MIRGLVLLAALGFALYLFKRWSEQAGPARTQRLLSQIGLGAGALLLLVLLARGGPAAILLAPLLLPLLLNGRSLWRRLVAAGGPAASPGDSESSVATRFLRMTLDHANGEMQGEVLQGRYAGRKLSDLDLDELLELWRECQQDAQSAAVLEAYLDHTRDEDWRSRTRAQQHEEHTAGVRTSGPMDRREAYEILGLQPGASREEIKTAHRRLIQRLHPDHGGSDYLAARINEAKDLLLGH